MANLTFQEKDLIERVFGMGSGYVLDFSNRQFDEFMKDIIGCSIYDKYPPMSKAKLFREFWNDESEALVGKALIMGINYMKSNNYVNDNNRIQISELTKLAERLLGRKQNLKKPAAQVEEPTIDFNKLKQALTSVCFGEDRQKRGYEFEKYIYDLLQAFQLQPRRPYRTEFDQIDGSFMLNQSTVLIEVKFLENELIKNDLILFDDKIRRKSNFTKGVIFSHSKIKKEALELYEHENSRFVVMTVPELFIMFDRQQSLKGVLEAKFRKMEETGKIYVDIMYL